MTLSVKLNQLANNLQKKYNVTDRLTIEDMINGGLQNEVSHPVGGK